MKPKSKELGACFSSRPVAFSPIAIDRQEVDIVSHAKLLGVLISNALKWNFNVDYVCKRPPNASVHSYLSITPV